MRKLPMLLCMIWIIVIFHMSGENGITSNYRSCRIVNLIKPYYEKFDNRVNGIESRNANPSNKDKRDADMKIDNKLNFYIRKGAHFTVYMILAVLVGYTLLSVDLKGKDAAIYILFICLFCGVIDEYVQSFVYRTSKVSDILIDLCGSIFGMILFYISFRLFNRIDRKRKAIIW